jgi:putative transposase
MKKIFTPEQIIKILQEGDAGTNVKDIIRKYDIAKSTYYKWKNKFYGMNINEVKRLKKLEKENSKLKQLLAEATLDNKALKDVISKKW